MEGVDFDGSNFKFTAPDDMPDCNTLPVYRGPNHEGRPVIISCWKLSPEDLELIVKTGCIWLWIWGDSMPPVALDTNHPMKEEDNVESR